MLSVHNRKGFTLIELLVVIAIVGILVAVGTANFILAQRQARDVRRQQDMEKAQTVMETFFAETGNYPANASEISTAFGGQIPKDPQDPTTTYTLSSNTGGFCFCARLEEGGGNANGITTNATSFSCNWTSTGDRFCITNQQ